MAAGSAAAAAGGWKRGAAIGQAAGRNRAALALAMESPEDIFVNIFRKAKGASTLERLEQSFATFSRTGLGRKMKVKKLEPDEIEFMLKMTDRAGGKADKKITEAEARFAFKVWVSFGKMHTQVEETFERYDIDQSGCLDAEELQTYLVELNEGCQVSKAEVNYVTQFVDLNKDGKLDKRELVFGTCVWYCDVNYADFSQEVPRSSTALKSTGNPKVKVIIIGCFNLRNADGFFGGLSDPFCVCTVPGRPDTAVKTQTVHDELNPTWNHEGFIYDLHMDDTLEFTIFDEDFMKPPSLLGQSSFAFNEYYPDGFIGSRMLTNAGSAQGKASILLRITVLEPITALETQVVQGKVLEPITALETQVVQGKVLEPITALETQDVQGKRDRHAHQKGEGEGQCTQTSASSKAFADAAAAVAFTRRIAPKTPKTLEALAYPDAPDICQPLAAGPGVDPLMSWQQLLRA